MRVRRIFGVSISVMAISLCPQWPYEGGPVTGGGTISGEVKMVGAAGVPEKLEVSKDQEVCGKEPIVAEDLSVSTNKGIRNAVISLVSISKGKPLDQLNPQPALTQKGCVFRPHVLLVPAGAPLAILNEDGILHNFHTTSEQNTPINRAQPQFMKKMTVKLDKPEIVKAACDVHSWMNSWIVVADHPYFALTDESGAYSLKDVPPGTYQLKVWHATLGTVTKEVTVKTGEESKIGFDLGKS